MLWMTAYLWWSQEKSKIIEANGCANTLLWEINNYLYFALTSKSLKINDNYISPDFYYIQLSWSNCSSNSPCDKVVLSYSTGNDSTNKHTYKELTPRDICRNNSNIQFAWSWELIKMNKWFIPTTHTDRVFSVEYTWSKVSSTWNIIILLWWKEISKWNIDWRSQTISLKACKLYDENTRNKCTTRED